MYLLVKSIGAYIYRIVIVWVLLLSFLNKNMRVAYKIFILKLSVDWFQTYMSSSEQP